MHANPYAAVIQAPFGRLGLRCSDDAVQELEFLSPDYPLLPPEGEFVREAVRRLEAYLDDPREGINLPVVVEGTPFQRRVWAKLRAIPSGRTRRYGELALELGTAARAIGGACRANPVPLIVPCHRVVARSGLGGFTGAASGTMLRVKQWLLAHESRV